MKIRKRFAIFVEIGSNVDDPKTLAKFQQECFELVCEHIHNGNFYMSNVGQTFEYEDRQFDLWEKGANVDK